MKKLSLFALLLLVSSPMAFAEPIDADEQLDSENATLEDLAASPQVSNIRASRDARGLVSPWGLVLKRASHVSCKPVAEGAKYRAQGSLLVHEFVVQSSYYGLALIDLGKTREVKLESAKLFKKPAGVTLFCTNIMKNLSYGRIYTSSKTDSNSGETTYTTSVENMTLRTQMVTRGGEQVELLRMFMPGSQNFYSDEDSYGYSGGSLSWERRWYIVNKKPVLVK